MAEDHPGACILHDCPDFITHFHLVTVDGTFGTGTFSGTEGTEGQSPLSVIKKAFAFLTGDAGAVMVFPAVSGDHEAENFFLSFDSPVHRYPLSGQF